MEPHAIYMSPGDPWVPPRGGQTAFAVQSLNAFGARLAVVAPCEEGTFPVGRWTTREWKGEKIRLFNIGSLAPKNKSVRPLVPRRILYRHKINSYLSSIREIETRNLFCDSPELLGVLGKRPWDSFCYRFAGLNNPVAFSRYRSLRFLAPWFHRNMMRGLKLLHPDVLLASTDRDTITRYEEDNADYLSGMKLSFFPTRYDPSVFFPVRKEKIDESVFPKIVVVGRLSWIKGWRLALDVCKLLAQEFPFVRMTFIGDGEDRALVEKKIKMLNLRDRVVLTGFLPPEKVREELNDSDLYLSTSFREGWSVALLEALACGKVCVTSDAGGVSEMIKNGENGEIVDVFEPNAFCDAIRRSLQIARSCGRVSSVSLDKSKPYSLQYFARDLEALWPPLRLE